MLKIEKSSFKIMSLIYALVIGMLLVSIGCKGQKKEIEGSKIKSNVVLDLAPDLLKKNQYEGDKKVGLWKTFYNSGNLKTEGVYKEDRKEGLHKEWDDKGVLALEGLYKNGKANGLMKWFYEQGHLAGVENTIKLSPKNVGMNMAF